VRLSEPIHAVILHVEGYLHVIRDFGRVVSAHCPPLEISCVHIVELGLAAVSERDGDCSNLMLLAIDPSPLVRRVDDVHRVLAP